MTGGYLDGNRIDLLCSGNEYFPALIAAIDAALQEVHLETYIFANDAAGQAVAAALSRASKRGVVVRVLVDGFGARNFADGLGLSLKTQGAEILVYRPEVGRWNFRRHRLRRLHRKLAVIDSRIAFVGGINIIDDIDTPGQIPPRFDYAIEVEGPLVREIHDAMRTVWKLVRWARFGHRPPAPAPLTDGREPAGIIRAALLIRDNLRHRRDIENAYLEAIAAAREEILIASAYFLPGRRFRRALSAAAQRGVRVTLLLQGRVEYLLLYYATQSLYERILGSGIHIFEYRKSFLHAKVAVIDGAWATVGSSNIDPFSLLLAREANVVVQDTSFAATLRNSLLQAMAEGATECLASHLKLRPWYQRWVSRLAYGAIRLLLGMTRHGGEKPAS